jgi:malate dehydrogenase (oxaloacetate-decarboxylating)(NADP+)
VEAVTEVFPKICIQWEDLPGVDAIRILDKYRDRVCTFNDDIQGTAAIATAGIITSNRFSGKPFIEEKILFLGAGAAAFGIADMLVHKFEKAGLTKRKRTSACPCLI